MAENPKLTTSEDEVKHIPLTDIFVDYDWNSRSFANVISDHSETNGKEGSGLAGLSKGILLDGQDEPVILRPVDKEGFYRKGVKTPYALVAGFRRYEAIRRLNNPVVSTKDVPGEVSAELGKLIETRKAEKKTLVPNTADGTIRAVVRNLSEKDAEILNLRENTQRDDLTPPDLMMAVRRLENTHGLKQQEIANSLGIQQGHVSKLSKVAKCHEDILHHWRNGGEFQGLPSSCRATIMELVDVGAEPDKQKQLEAYLRILQSKLPATAEDNNQWVVSAKKKAMRIAAQLGTLEKHEFLTVNVEEDGWKDYMEHFVKNGKKELTSRQAKSVAKAAFEAYTEALNAKDDEEESEDEGEDEGKKGKSAAE
jgi:predicted XRE-type DNA-binding protein